MKRIIYLVVYSLFATITVSAQSTYIEYRKVLDNSDNVSIKTKEVFLNEKGQTPLGFSFMYETSMIESPENQGYSLFITFKTLSEKAEIPYEGKLLIRTVNGKVISLTQSTQRAVTLFNPESGFPNVSYLKSAFDHYDDIRRANVYKKFGKYPISEDDLLAIVNEGIVKIRLETTASSIECEYPAEESIRVKLTKKENHNIASYTLTPYYEALLNNIDTTRGF